MAFSLLNSGRQLVSNLGDTDSLKQSVGGIVGGYMNPIDEPQHAYMFEVDFYGMSASRASKFRFYAKNAGLPSVTNEPMKRYYAGKQYSYATKDTSPNRLTLTFWDNQDLDVYRYFLQWMNSINDTHAARSVNPNNYKREVHITLKDRSDFLIDGEFIFTGVSPTEVSEVQLSYDSNEVMQFDVQLVFDQKTMTGELPSALSSGLDAAGDFVSDTVSGAIEGFKGFF